MQDPKSRVKEVNGKLYLTPRGVSRVDSHNTHGWQARYHKASRFFSDGSHGGTAAALKLAVAAAVELREKHQSKTISRYVHRAPNSNKANQHLPPGITGPRLVKGKGARPRSIPFAEFRVHCPAERLGGKSRIVSVYIANERTWSAERVVAALAKAIRIREAALARMQFV